MVLGGRCRAAGLFCVYATIAATNSTAIRAISFNPIFLKRERILVIDPSSTRNLRRVRAKPLLDMSYDG
jgi:hypothetical protein